MIRMRRRQTDLSIDPAVSRSCMQLVSAPAHHRRVVWRKLEQGSLDDPGPQSLHQSVGIGAGILHCIALCHPGSRQ